MWFRLLANAVMVGHVAFMVALAFAWLGPHWLQLTLYTTLALATFIGKARYRGRCPVTIEEYRLRRKGGDRSAPRGMMRRMLGWVGYRTSEKIASRWAYGIALVSLLLSLLRAAL